MLNNKHCNFYIISNNESRDTTLFQRLNHPKRTLFIPKLFQGFFRHHNILLLKSLDNIANIDSYYEGYAWACFLKSNGFPDNTISIDEVTLSILCSSFPSTLVQYLTLRKYTITNLSSGVYRIDKDGFISTQIIVLDELPVHECVWLNTLLPLIVSKEMFPPRIYAITNSNFNMSAEANIH